MRIVFDHQRFSVQKYGGVSRYFQEISTWLSEASGNQVEIFAPFYVNEYIRGSKLIRPFGVHIPHFYGVGLPIRHVNSALSALMLENRADIDVFHETYFSKTDHRPRRSRTVLTVFDMIHELYPEEFRDSGRTSSAKFAAVQRADHVICISHNTQRDLIKLTGVSESKTSVVYLGCAPTPARIEASASSASLGEATHPAGKRIILFVGERRGYKNFERFIRAYAASPSLREQFIVVSFGGGGFSEGETAVFEELGLLELDVRHATGNDLALSSLYDRAAMLVYPSIYEGFGLPPLEAMSRGCPVACSFTSSLPEVVGEAAKMFDPLSVSEIKDAMEQLSSDATRTAKLIERGLDRARQFSWSQCASSTQDTYTRLLDSRT